MFKAIEISELEHGRIWNCDQRPCRVHLDIELERWHSPETGEWRCIADLAGWKQTASPPSCVSHQDHHNQLTRTWWLTAIRIDSLTGLEDRCSKSSCQQCLLPVKVLGKHTPLPGGSWYPWHPFLPLCCTIPTSGQASHALSPVSLCLCIISSSWKDTSHWI